jgi:phosphoribosylformylglycinamidine cyclo-ligase
MANPKPPLSYDSAGVQTLQVEGGLRDLAAWVTKTFDFNAAKPLLPLGYYANVLQVTPDLGIAISTDSVGTKVLVAEEMEQYDTVGIDCIAMNANDIVCVGARPVAMVDFIAVERADPRVLGAIAKGLHEGARRAGISIPGGEVAQLGKMIRGVRDGSGFELIGTCIGTVHPQRLLIGTDARPGDIVVGIASSGIHSNGFTLARRVLFDHARLKVTDRVPELDCTIGEALLRPTYLYVKEAVEMIDQGLAIRAMLHITGEGFLNLPRVEAPVGFVIDALLDTPPICSVIQSRGEIDDPQMYRVFNMGVGFCVVVDPKDAARVIAIAKQHGKHAAPIGYTVADPERRVWIPQRTLVSRDDVFVASDAAAPPRPVG